MTKVIFDFMGKRNYMFGFSAVLVVASIAALLIQGLTFGIEFQGGTVMHFTHTGDVTIEEVRSALADSDVEGAQIQSADDGGFIVRTSEGDPDVANTTYQQAMETLGIPSENGDVTTIGPGWGKNITRSALLALALSIAAILLYISIRFEYKMSLTAVVALVHDIVITLGIYSLMGREVTPNTIAALLTIMGYSLYDTIVVFHRIKENGTRLVKKSFMAMANESINQVIARSITTTITSLRPP
ncbi:MAG: protein translocase subunit SecF, partial [Actinomycetota bacterium]|nr:protein translocase subunit SecF [Actinomycetota bacterium]